MFTADVPGIARSASGEMARTAESRLCRERQDRGSGRRDLVFVDRETPYIVEEVKNAAGKVVRRRMRALLPEEVAYAARHDIIVGHMTTHELVPPRRHAVAAADLEALRDRFARR